MLVNTGCGSTFYRKKTGISRPRSCGESKFSHPSLDPGTYREADEDRDFHSPHGYLFCYGFSLYRLFEKGELLCKKTSKIQIKLYKIGAIKLCVGFVSRNPIEKSGEESALYYRFR